ncbi:periplasmic murein tripeptide transport protein, also negative regulator of mulitple antibiotic resistance [Salmonella enterica subsp. enterica]|nr:periplasmic murein tripeptide transport protein, also negative regulator of mulitple antibiotic resistance [Salmonella enterica subsp. enterica]
MRHSVSVTCCALLVSSFSLAYAADVPGGTVLAEKQELVRHIKDEPASLDPAKAVGLPEIQVIRDLFEGLVNQNEKGEIIPGVASQWKSNDNRIWTFTLRDNAQWADGTPVTAQDFVYSWQRLVDPKTLSPSPGLPLWLASLMRRPLSTVKSRRISLASVPWTPTLCVFSLTSRCPGLPV